MSINPLVFMVINMTIVFAVLIAIWILIKIIQVVDPTKAKKKSPEPVKAAPAAAPVAAAPVASNNDEVIAAIVAAVVAMGYSSDQIASIRPVKNAGWTSAARIAAVETF